MLDNKSTPESCETIRHRRSTDSSKPEMRGAGFRQQPSGMERLWPRADGDRERAKETVAPDRIGPRPRVTMHVRKRFRHEARCFAQTTEISRAAVTFPGIRATPATKNKSRAQRGRPA